LLGRLVSKRWQAAGGKGREEADPGYEPAAVEHGITFKPFHPSMPENACWAASMRQTPAGARQSPPDA
jgi:hypothetical protein